MGLLAQQTGDVTHNRTTVGRLGCRRRHLQRTFAIPLRNQVGWRNVKVFRQGQGHSFGAAVGQSKVVARIANSIRMPFDQDYSTWVFLDRITDDGPDLDSARACSGWIAAEPVAKRTASSSISGARART